MTYQAISTPVILRDYLEPVYRDNEHKLLVNIADALYHVGITREQLTTKGKQAYDRYGTKFWGLVLKDIQALESQITQDNVDLLAYDYANILNEGGSSE